MTALMVSSLPWSHRPIPVRRDSALDCQAGPSPDSPGRCVVPPVREEHILCTRKELAMKAIRVHEQAGISGLSFEDAPDPAPTIGDVLVKVAAVGITHNELDWPLRTDRNGHPRDAIIPGQEVSGVVTALGMGTAGFAV